MTEIFMCPWVSTKGSEGQFMIRFRACETTSAILRRVTSEFTWVVLTLSGRTIHALKFKKETERMLTGSVWCLSFPFFFFSFFLFFFFCLSLSLFLLLHRNAFACLLPSQFLMPFPPLSSFPVVYLYHLELLSLLYPHKLTQCSLESQSGRKNAVLFFCVREETETKGKDQLRTTTRFVLLASCEQWPMSDLCRQKVCLHAANPTAVGSSRADYV